ncbi:MAG: DUF749 family protein [Candidatus Hydrothermarchaeales archaeon]
MGEFIATLSDIKDIKRVPDDLKGIVNFKADIEKREIRGDERVAILNIVDTYSYFAVFLDKGKSVEDVEKEVEEGAHATLNADTREILKKILDKMKKE